MVKVKAALGNVGVQVVIAMVLGTLVGAMMGPSAAVFAPLGDLFINLIKMLVVPLIAIAIIAGAANLGGSSAAGKLGAATFAFFLGTSALAVALALVAGELFQPGHGVDLSSARHLFSNEYADKGGVPGAVETVLGMIPTNIFQSLNDANILQIMVFCLFLGIALSRQPDAQRQPLMQGMDTIVNAFIWMINVVMWLAPLGVFGLMADAVGTFGFAMLNLVMNLFLVYVFAILVFGFVVYPLLVKLFSSQSALEFLSKMKKPQAVALSTSSSMATLPVTMEVVEEELGVSKPTAAFVLPLGATINMSGNAIYYGLVAVFFAQVFNVDLGLPAYLAIIFTSTLGAIGQAGVPGPSFLVVAVLLAAGIPIEGLPLLFALDRIFDMIRTALNITGDAACAVIVDRLAKPTE
ncbi:dicarboxylate/amino acid:cation symporter [Simiduia agarivorans]|uniref:Proton/glutamate symporter n=1 Tax=Simiduia agarivorans (strain DSM 21679 / JCM 13881 / BCRC 17597 / SA1) TaxID=1117647 RepID=K4KGE3_SIMAS|nr:dicarboxylate/amino acid:cation symporter [Simiduia agarivorans]AFU97250.1 proton/glutamate symporter [Simiduia agarivorans SA1 = DSM 21679]